MNPGLVVKLRPSGPWRIGPDSGARNRVDSIYHSDSLYSAVTSAMARLGSLEEWLDATSRPQKPAAAPAVCFSSCFPFIDDIAYVVPPRTAWPPASQAMSARVRWKSARFVPLEIVQAILAGRKLDENKWTMDGPSECLAPAGSPGPFRTAVRWSAAVDRLTGATERHSTACLEFRAGCGLWTVASFADEAARDRWMEPVKAAFRLLADTGFGGERSRGWGRSEPPVFVEGTLPEMILPAIRETVRPVAEPAIEPAPETPLVETPAEPAIEEPAQSAPHLEEVAAEPTEAEASVEAPSEIAPLLVESAEASEAPSEPEPTIVAALAEKSPAEDTPPCGAGASACQPDPTTPEPEAAQAGGAGASACQPEPTTPEAEAAQAGEAGASACQPEATTSEPEAAQACGAGASACQPEATTPEPEAAQAGEAGASACQPEPTTPEPEAAQAGGAGASACQPEATTPEPEAAQAGGAGASACQPEATTSEPEAAQAGEAGASACQPEPTTPEPESAQAQTPVPPASAPGFEDARPHWLLSLFTPAPADAVDWKRGGYALLSRGGRVESPAGSGELKKLVHMVAEGSVLYAAPAPRGAAVDVAPDGFAHPVYRAGFAVAVPLPKVS